MFSKRSTKADGLTPLRWCAAGLFWLLLVAGGAAAQENAPPPWETWDAQASSAREVIEQGEASREALAQLRDRLEEQRQGAARIAAEAGERIKQLEKELEALGPAPLEGETEAPEAAQLRAELNKSLADARADQGRAQRAVERVRGLLDSIAALGQRRFIDRLERRGPSPLNPANWLEAKTALTDAVGRIRREVLRTLDAPSERERFAARAPLALIAIGAALVALFGLRGAALGLILRRAGAETVRSRRLILGLGAAAARIITAAVAAGLALYALGAVGVLGVVGDTVLQGVAFGLGQIILAYALASALFSPQSAVLRLSHLSDGDARRAFVAAMWLAGATAVFTVFGAAAEVVEASDAADAVFTFVVVCWASAALWALAQALRDPARGAVAEDASIGSQGAQLLRRVAVAISFAAPVLALFGYAFAARFILFPTIASLAVIAVAYLIFELISQLVDVYLETAGDSGQRLRLLPIMAALLLISAALPVLALVWGATVADLSAAYTIAAEGLTFGEVKISPMDFVVFALVFGVGYTITRMAQRVLRGTVLPQAGMSAGASSALTSGVGYIGVFLAALAAISATGLDLSNLAIVAGALSVGVGFGLQNIVNNFVSGIILLVERPIKVGDWIEAGGQAGYVKKVNVRSTEIETFDRASFIMPNSDLIAGSVLNWTHSDLTGRVRVPVGVAYDTDPRKVEKILLEIGKEHPMVVANPAPIVYFMGFGADALEFELRVYLRDVNWMLSVKSDINFQVIERFREEGIEIPFSQSDILIRNPDELARAFRGEVRGEE